MKMLVKSGDGVPAGTYVAKFEGVEEIENEYGEGARWQFEIAAGKLKGQKASRITTPVPSPHNACGRILAGIAGKEIAAGQSVDTSDYIGQRYLIAVGSAKPGGATRVESVASADAEDE